MAKVSGILKVFGTISGITMYYMEGQHVARSAQSITTSKYKTGKNYAMFRASGKAMGHSAKMSSSFRRPLGIYTKGIAENRMYCRMNALMRKLVDCDFATFPGERTAAQGMATAAGRSLWSGFEFNRHLSLGQVLRYPYALDTLQGTLTMTNFIPAESLHGPAAATHAGLMLLDYGFNFGTKKHGLGVGAETIVALDRVPREVALQADVQAVGTRFILLRILFYQEFNGELYALLGHDCGVVSVLAVV